MKLIKCANQIGESSTDIFGEGSMTVAQAAAFLNISRSKVYQLVDAGRLRSTKIDRTRRIPRRVLLDFAAAHLQGG
jgi:excisionase family DNA binding protein